jgi:hypothetical protein
MAQQKLAEEAAAFDKDIQLVLLGIILILMIFRILFFLFVRFKKIWEDIGDFIRLHLPKSF